MKYISFENGSWDHRPYWAYLASVKQSMRSDIYSFAANVDNHDLTHPNSLHDSWLSSCNITEQSSRPRSIAIDLRFLGSRHDRYIHIRYGHVIRYAIDSRILDPKSGHGDLMVHEMRLTSHNSLEHEMVFSCGASMLFEFEEFDHSILIELQGKAEKEN